MSKVRLAFYGDSPTSSTGFGTVSRAILTYLHNTGKYDINVFGINFHGNPHKYPFPIWPAGLGSNDPYGRQRAFSWLVDQEFDVLLMNQDAWLLDTFMRAALPKLRLLKDFVSIAYFPVDGRPRDSWMETMGVFDVPVTYTDFAFRVSTQVQPGLASRLKVIPHGVNTSDFYPLKKQERIDFRKEYFGKHADKFIVTSVNRNQPRKDLPRLLMAFKEFNKQVPDSVCYLNCSAHDEGGNLLDVFKSLGLTINKDVLLPHNKFDPGVGIPQKLLNGVYNASDVTASCTYGEGWGLSMTESMATKTPVIAPRNTSCEEIVGVNEERGYLVPSGHTLDHYTMMPKDEVVRPITSTSGMVENLLHVYENREEAKAKAEVAYKWITSNLVWDKHICPQWDALITDALQNKTVKHDPEVNVVKAEEV